MTCWGGPTNQLCDGQSRRDFLKVGMLGAAGLTLGDVLRLRGRGGRIGRVFWSSTGLRAGSASPTVRGIGHAMCCAASTPQAHPRSR